MKEYYAVVYVNNNYDEKRTGRNFQTRKEAENDLIMLMKKYNSNGGFVKEF